MAFRIKLNKFLIISVMIVNGFCDFCPCFKNYFQVCSHFHRCLDTREESYSYPSSRRSQSRPYETYNVVNTHTQQTNKSTRLPKSWTESSALLIFTLFVVDCSPYPSHVFCSLVLSPSSSWSKSYLRNWFEKLCLSVTQWDISPQRCFCMKSGP